MPKTSPPALDVWFWAEEQPDGDWWPKASLTSVADVTPVRCQLPAKRTYLLTLLAHLRRWDGLGDKQPLIVRAWAWVEHEDGEPYAFLSLERPTYAEAPDPWCLDLRLRADSPRRVIGVFTRDVEAALVALGVANYDTVLDEQRARKVANRHRKAQEKARRAAEARKSAAARTSREAARPQRKKPQRKRTSIRVVSGGLPGLGKRR